MIYINNLICFMAIVVVVALAFLLFPTLQDKAAAICIIDIVKEATPSDGTDFEFTCTGGQGGNCNGAPEFSLIDGDSQEIRVDAGDTATVVELVPDGWGLGDIICNASDSFMTFDFNAVRNGVVMTCIDPNVLALRTCTFSNIKRTPIPTISEWGLIAMTGVLGIIGFIALRRRQAAA